MFFSIKFKCKLNPWNLFVRSNCRRFSDRWWLICFVSLHLFFGYFSSLNECIICDMQYASMETISNKLKMINLRFQSYTIEPIRLWLFLFFDSPLLHHRICFIVQTISLISYVSHYFFHILFFWFSFLQQKQKSYVSAFRAIDALKCANVSFFFVFIRRKFVRLSVCIEDSLI